jgi:DNA end-binding protein Ku
MVAMPIQIFPAIDTKSSISFNMLHSKCGSRVKQQYVCPKEDNVKVPADEIQKGYEFAKDQYILFTKDELEALQEEPNQTIGIEEFVPASAIDTLYYDKPYYLGPGKGGGKAYALLTEALKASKRVAVARYAARGKQYIVCLRPVNGGLVMQQLLYADEIRAFSEVGIPQETVGKPELKMALSLIDQLSSDRFNAGDYEDAVRKRVQEQIDRKVKTGEKISAAGEPLKAEVTDIMEALRKSLAAPQKKRNGGKVAARA